nr:28S ribosomal protein S22, mitochondrial-like [Lytechinus pictus]
MMQRSRQLLSTYSSIRSLLSLSVTGRKLCKSSFNNRGFQDEEVQRLLKRITGLQLDKVFKPAKQTLEAPNYKLVSSKKLEEMHQEAEEEAKRRLQMPPVLPERTPIDEVLEDDEGLAGLDTANVVFTDITYGLNDRKRFVVVRERSGRLRKASWEERDRIMQIYFPRERREVEIPPLFHDEQLPTVFANERHEFLLDAACVQFEPDAAGFLAVHQKAYEDIASNERYDLLRSTRHFGGMAFYFTKHKRIDGLLTDMIQRDLFDDAVDLIHLYNIIHPTSPVAQDAKEHNLDSVELIKAYIRLDSHHSGKLELALQAWENARREPEAQGLAE